MEYKQIDRGSFLVAGLAIRTRNDGRSQEEINALWKRWFAESYATLLSNRVSDDIYCIYTDYDSVFKGNIRP